MTAILLAVSLTQSPIWYYGRLMCPFYCNKTWVCDFIPCKDEAKALKICAAKPCYKYPR